MFTGWIAGLGTDRGHRIVIGHWPTSPYGVVTDAMVEDRPDATGSHGFIDASGAFSTVDVAGARGTLLTRIKIGGSVTGVCTDAVGGQHGLTGQ